MSEKRRKRSYDEIQSLNAQVEICSSLESDVAEDNFNKPGLSKMYVKQSTRGRIDFITPKLAAALDKCKISDRDAVHRLISTAEALGEDVEKLIINRSSIQNSHIRFRKERAEKIRNNYLVTIKDSVVIHWDGKLLPSLTGQKSVD
ncbi:uncharacterized protein LOC126898861 [Daktulosphaira vitifoliae]|uniref:uncharacterized protein LOC126898861 n=1 Tax=Daktulosphaira vitifoliae TaxID=58002 RepID=UPI0021AA7393|nr:uncharacterized protein LOC126898861 [Daktulosphaira vitifoliae]